VRPPRLRLDLEQFRPAPRTCRYLPGQPWRAVSWHTAGSEREPMADLRRRELIALLGGAAAAWPLAARAQEPVTPVIGFLGATSPDGFTNRVRAFRQGLKEAGFVERWAENQLDRLPALAADLVRKRLRSSSPAAVPLRRLQPRRQRRLFRSFSRSRKTPLALGLSPASPGREPTSLASTSSSASWCLNGWRSCASWFPH
jgi:hypothetical protein